MIDLLASQGHGWGGGWGGGPWIGLVWVAVWAAVIVGAIYLLRRRPPAERTDRGAEAVLAARYARGDISDEEYRERLEVLRETKA